MMCAQGRRRIDRQCTCVGRAKPRSGPEAGWTLAELMVVCAIVAIFAAIAVPHWTGVALQMRTQAASVRVLGDVNYARLMSLRTGVPHYLQVTGDPDILYAVQRANDPGAIDPATDPVLRTIDLVAKMPGVRFDRAGETADPYGAGVVQSTPGQLVFDGRGLPAAPAAFFLASEDGANAFVISVTGAGRTRLWRKTQEGWR